MKLKTIELFRDEYAFLSNFYACPVTYRGITYGSSEAAFQAQKTEDVREQVKFTLLSASESKKAGKKLDIRPDWRRVKYTFMYEIVLQKFVQNDELRQKLFDTGDAVLIEGNWWSDTDWGVCNGEGQNNLGRILMSVRDYLLSVHSALFLLNEGES